MHRGELHKTIIGMFVTALVSLALFASREASVVQLSGWKLVVVGVLSSTFVYSMLFVGMVYCWEEYVWPYLHKHAWLEGYWRVENYYDDGTSSTGVYRLTQRLDDVRLEDGKNTAFKQGNAYTAVWSSTSADLYYGKKQNAVSLVYSYEVIRHAPGREDQVVSAVEKLRVDAWAISGPFGGMPIKLVGSYKSSLGATGNLRPSGQSINTRLSKEEYDQECEKHLELIRRLAALNAAQTSPAASPGTSATDARVEDSTMNPTPPAKQG